jgi:hypothetical protein
MPRTKKDDEQFSPEEAQRRFEAALRGARVAGHKKSSEIEKKDGSAPKKRATEPKSA